MEPQEAKRADVAAATGGEVVKPAAGDAGAVTKMNGPSAPANKAATPTGSADRGATCIIILQVSVKKLQYMERHTRKRGAGEETVNDQGVGGEREEQSGEQEKLERKKAEYAEKMRNQVAAIHKAAEEKRATVEATRHEEIIKYEEMAAKHRSKGTTPTKFLSCFGS
uniref:Remorin C-terminal domain-containing protein n=1 Tax=Oryza meridionalis TaxID=40149 RepID=A0A0E0CTC5_9ORYZ